MSSFFKQTAETMIAKHIGRFPLLKIHFIIDRHPIADHLGGYPTAQVGA